MFPFLLSCHQCHAWNSLDAYLVVEVLGYTVGMRHLRPTSERAPACTGTAGPHLGEVHRICTQQNSIFFGFKWYFSDY